MAGSFETWLFELMYRQIPLNGGRKGSYLETVERVACLKASCETSTLTDAGDRIAIPTQTPQHARAIHFQRSLIAQQVASAPKTACAAPQNRQERTTTYHGFWEARRRTCSITTSAPKPSAGCLACRCHRPARRELSVRGTLGDR